MERYLAAQHNLAGIYRVSDEKLPHELLTIEVSSFFLHPFVET